MFLLLVAGIGCLALAGFQFVRPRAVAERQRRAALDSVRALEADAPTETDARPLSAFLAQIPPVLAKVHQRLWPKESPDDVTMKLLRAGASRRFTSELYMAARVALTTIGVLAGLTFAHGAGRILLALVFAAAGILVPGFLLSKAATRRAEQIDAELPHFIDQLAIAIEAGMSFDAGLNYLADATDGPLAEEMRRVLTELRVGESRRTAIRSFALRVGSEDAMAFANAVLASDQLGSPLAGILRAQAHDLRHRRQLHAEERAQKTPVKMLFPMVIFILPVMFGIILGPAFLGSHGIL
jgi:tight adherence protein C